MRVLITGAFGRLGEICIDQALSLGYQVRAFDIETPATRKSAIRYNSRIETVLGDIRDEALLPGLVKDVDAIIHNAAILPPVSENQPDFAKAINVTATIRLVEAAEKASKDIRFIFPSSVTVFGLPSKREVIKQASDQLSPTDQYTSNKAEVEDYLLGSDINWTILRVGVSVDSRTLSTDRKTFSRLLSVSADNPVEWVHPKDIALAMCNAANHPDVKHKILLLGGGKHCQVTQHQFLGAAFSAMGLTLSEKTFQQEQYYTHWMDTNESQSLLQYQQHSFDDYQQEMDERLKNVRRILKPLSPALNPVVNFVLRRL